MGTSTSVSYTHLDVYKRQITDPENQIIGVAHADAYEDSLYVIEQIKKRIKVRDVIRCV